MLYAVKFSLNKGDKLCIPANLKQILSNCFITKTLTNDQPQTESMLGGDSGEPFSSKKLLLQYDLEVLEEEARYLPSSL